MKKIIFLFALFLCYLSGDSQIIYRSSDYLFKNRVSVGAQSEASTPTSVWFRIGDSASNKAFVTPTAEQRDSVADNGPLLRGMQVWDLFESKPYWYDGSNWITFTNEGDTIYLVNGAPTTADSILYPTETEMVFKSFKVDSTHVGLIASGVTDSTFGVGLDSSTLFPLIRATIPGGVSYTFENGVFNAGGNVIKADTTVLVTWAFRQKLADSLGALIAGGGISLSAIGASPNANAATLTGSVLNLEPASASFGGVVTTTTQTFAGAKTFNSNITVSDLTVGTGNTSDSTNVAIGLNTLTSSVSGMQFNVAIGQGAMQDINNASSDYNVAVGYNSLNGASGTTANLNVSIGYIAMAAATSAQGNVAAGVAALNAATDATFNVAIGYNSLTATTTGDHNVAVGNAALSTNTGNRNVGLGFRAGDAVNTDSSIYIGNDAGRGVGSSATLWIDNSNTSTPLIHGNFRADSLRINGYLSIRDMDSTGTGTAQNMVYITQEGRLQIAAVPSGSSQNLQQTIDNGSTLTSDETITMDANTLTITGSGTGTNAPLSVANSSTGSALVVNSTSAASPTLSVINGGSLSAISASSVGTGVDASSSGGSAFNGTTIGGNTVALLQNSTASTNSEKPVITMRAAVTSGVGAAGLGGQIIYEAENDAGAMTQSARIATLWTSAASGSEDANMAFAVKGGGSVSTLMTVGSVGATDFIRASARLQGNKGADVASANDLTLGNGNLFTITGSTQINAITTANWQAGSEIALMFASTPTVKNNTAGGAGTAVMLLAGGVDFTASANDILRLIYDGTSWVETGRSVN